MKVSTMQTEAAVKVALATRRLVWGLISEGCELSDVLSGIHAEALNLIAEVYGDQIAIECGARNTEAMRVMAEQADNPLASMHAEGRA